MIPKRHPGNYKFDFLPESGFLREQAQEGQDFEKDFLNYVLVLIIRVIIPGANGTEPRKVGVRVSPTPRIGGST